MYIITRFPVYYAKLVEAKLAWINLKDASVHCHFDLGLSTGSRALLKDNILAPRGLFLALT